MPALAELVAAGHTPLTSRIAAPASRAGIGAAQLPNPFEQQDEQSLLSAIGAPMLSGLGMAGALLDYPASISRDLIGGITTGDWQKYDPTDQLGSPLSFDNRVFGRELLSDWNWLAPNKETGFVPFSDPAEFGRDVAGFAADVVTDPLAWLTFGGSALTQGGRTARAAGLLDEATQLGKTQGLGKRMARQKFGIEDLIKAAPEPQVAREAAQRAAKAQGIPWEQATGDVLGRQFGVGLPFADPVATFNAPGGQALNKMFDVAGGAIAGSALGRGVRGLFDTRVGGTFTPIKQEIHEAAHPGRSAAKGAARKAELEVFDRADVVHKAFEDEFGDTLSEPFRAGQAPPEGWRSVKHVTDREFDEFDVAQAGRLGNYGDGIYFTESDEMAQSLKSELPNQKIVEAHIKPEAPFDSDAVLSPQEVQNIVDAARAVGMKPTRKMLSGAQDGMPAETLLADLRVSDISPREILQRAGYDSVRYTGDFFGLSDKKNVWAMFDNAKMKRADRRGPGLQQGDVVKLDAHGNTGLLEQVGRSTSKVFYRDPDTGGLRSRRLSNSQLERVADNASTESNKWIATRSRDIFNRIAKMTGETDDIPGSFRFHGLEPPSTALADKLKPHVDDLRQLNQEQYQKYLDAGGRGDFLDLDEDGIAHMYRATSPKARKHFGTRREFQTKATQARQEATRTVPEAVVNRLLTRPKYRPGNVGDERAVQNILDDFAEHLNPRYGDDEVMGLRNHAEALRDYISGKPRTEMYTIDHVTNLGRYQEKVRLAHNVMEAVHKTFRRYAGESGEATLREAYNAAGMNAEKALERFANKFGMTVDEASNLRLPEDVARQVQGLTKISQSPEWVEKITDAIDGFTQWFKGNVTVPFPAFAARNFGSGQHINFVTGHMTGPKDIARYGAEFKDAYGLAKKAREAIETKDLSRLTADELEELREISAFRVIDPHKSFEGVERQLPDIEGMSPMFETVPGRLAKGQYGKAQEFVGQHPLKIDKVPGMPSLRRGWRTWFEAGSDLNRLVEWQNRVPMYRYLKKHKGYTPEQAAKEVQRLQVDYTEGFTPFERAVMKRAFPFYSFTKAISPVIFQTMMERPGGALGQTIRASTGPQAESGAVPEYVAQTTAFPMGELESGDQRYLTGLGLAHEVPLAYFGGGLSGGLMEAASQLNPLVKAPAEYATGESFFQRGPTGGRDIHEMDPMMGRLLTNVGLAEEGPHGKPPYVGGHLSEFAAANSPFARILSTARQATDPRKYEGGIFPGSIAAMNLGTGFKFSDISPAAQDQVIRDKATALALDELGGRMFEKAYIPKDVIAHAAQNDPETARRMQAFNALQTLLRNRSRERTR